MADHPWGEVSRSWGNQGTYAPGPRRPWPPRPGCISRSWARSLRGDRGRLVVLKLGPGPVRLPAAAVEGSSSRDAAATRSRRLPAVGRYLPPVGSSPGTRQAARPARAADVGRAHDVHGFRFLAVGRYAP